MAKTSNTHPEQIVDKNGKVTTVHKSNENNVSSFRASSISTPPAVDRQAQLEEFADSIITEAKNSDNAAFELRRALRVVDGARSIVAFQPPEDELSEDAIEMFEGFEHYLNYNDASAIREHLQQAVWEQNRAEDAIREREERAALGKRLRSLDPSIIGVTYRYDSAEFSQGEGVGVYAIVTEDGEQYINTHEKSEFIWRVINDTNRRNLVVRGRQEEGVILFDE